MSGLSAALSRGLRISGVETCKKARINILRNFIVCKVVVYPKKHLDELRGELGEVKAKIASGEQPVFDSVDALFAKLEAD